MNKVTKGTLAAAAAGALLLGGAGTYATWSDNQSLSAGTVSTGSLDLSLSVTETPWSDQNGSIGDISAFNMVPGDTLIYQATALVTARGDNLTGTFDATTSGLVATATVNGIEESLSEHFTVELVEPNYAAIKDTTGTNSLSFDLLTQEVSFSKAGTYKIPLSVTVALKAEYQEVQNLSVDLGEVDLLLKQS